MLSVIAPVARLAASIRAYLLSRAAARLRDGVARGAYRTAWRYGDNGTSCTLYRLHEGQWRAVACYLGEPGSGVDDCECATIEAELARWM